LTIENPFARKDTKEGGIDFRLDEFSGDRGESVRTREMLQPLKRFSHDGG
jgi:hypothetical protein